MVSLCSKALKFLIKLTSEPGGNEIPCLNTFKFSQCFTGSIQENEIPTRLLDSLFIKLFWYLSILPDAFSTQNVRSSFNKNPQNLILLPPLAFLWWYDSWTFRRTGQLQEDQPQFLQAACQRGSEGHGEAQLHSRDRLLHVLSAASAQTAVGTPPAVDVRTWWRPRRAPALVISPSVSQPLEHGPGAL